MKRFLACFLVTVCLLCLSSCFNAKTNDKDVDNKNDPTPIPSVDCVDNDHDGYCDGCWSGCINVQGRGDGIHEDYMHWDDDSDSICDFCSMKLHVYSIHKDINNDFICDVCGIKLEDSFVNCFSNDGDNSCDACALDIIKGWCFAVQQTETVKQHSNEDGDEYCDVCGMIPYIAHKSNGTGANGGICYNAKDENSDSVCDTCDNALSGVVGCYGKQFFTAPTDQDGYSHEPSKHTDHNFDFVCDSCDETLDESYVNCFDADYNRHCDACGISYDEKCGDTEKYKYVLDRTIAYFEAILDNSPDQNDALCSDDDHDGWCDMHTSPAHLVHGTISVFHWDDNADGHCDYCFISKEIAKDLWSDEESE